MPRRRATIPANETHLPALCHHGAPWQEERERVNARSTVIMTATAVQTGPMPALASVLRPGRPGDPQGSGKNFGTCQQVSAGPIPPMVRVRIPAVTRPSELEAPRRRHASARPSVGTQEALLPPRRQQAAPRRLQPGTFGLARLAARWTRRPRLRRRRAARTAWRTTGRPARHTSSWISLRAGASPDHGSGGGPSARG